MGHICYVCKTELKWHMLKITLGEILNNTNYLGNRDPPKGFTINDRICNRCHNNLLKLDSPEYLKIKEEGKPELLKQKDEIDSKLLKQKAGITAGECYWCKNHRTLEQFCFKSDWFLEDHAQCLFCTATIFRLSSHKIRELLTLKDTNIQKCSLLYDLDAKAGYAKVKANGQKYADLFTGASNAGIFGGFIPNSDTQFLENSANQTKGSLELQLMDVKQEMTRIDNLIKNERIILAKKHFFKTELAETNDEPIKILKIRLAKGEITKEEFDKIKEDLKD